MAIPEHRGDAHLHVLDQCREGGRVDGVESGDGLGQIGIFGLLLGRLVPGLGLLVSSVDTGHSRKAAYLLTTLPGTGTTA